MSKPPDNEMSENRGWLSIHSLLGANQDAAVGLVGAPLGLESLGPGRCDLAPGVIRATLKRISVYDLETGADLSALGVFDAGDVPVGALTAARWLAEILAGYMDRAR